MVNVKLYRGSLFNFQGCGKLYLEIDNNYTIVFSYMFNKIRHLKKKRIN